MSEPTEGLKIPSKADIRNTIDKEVFEKFGEEGLDEDTLCFMVDHIHDVQTKTIAGLKELDKIISGL